VQAEAQMALSTRETALRYTGGMRINGTLTHGLFLALTSACFTCGDSKGDESSSESTGLPENEYCDNPVSRQRADRENLRVRALGGFRTKEPVLPRLCEREVRRRCGRMPTRW
jgi:hypothetical protein